MMLKAFLKRIGAQTEKHSAKWWRRHWLVVLFLVTALPTGWRVALLTPIGQVADEPAHIARAGALLHGEILGHRVPFTPSGHRKSVIVPVVMVNNNLMNASFSEMGVTCNDRSNLTRTEGMRWSRLRNIDIDYNTIQYFPALYVPGAIGIAAGRVTGQRPLDALFTGRLFMLVAYAAIGAAAILVARFGRGLIFTILSLPMALGLGASFNQDGMIVAASALTAALLTLPRGHRGRWWALPLFTLVICSKPPYGLLLFAALLPLSAGMVRRRAALIALWAIPALIWVAVMTHTSLMPYLMARYHPGPLWPGRATDWFTSTDPMANLRVLLSDPVLFFTLPARFLMTEAGFLVHSGIGKLGWLSINLAPWMYPAWGGAIVIAAAGAVAQRQEDGGLAWSARDALLIVILVIISVWAVELAIYLSWDKVGSAALYGPQGRYYLPLIPFLLLAFPRVRVRWAGFAEVITALPALALASYDIVYLPGLMLRKFCLG